MLFKHHKKVLLLSALASAVLFASTFNSALAAGYNATNLAYASSADRESKPVAGRNRRRDINRLPSSTYPRAKTDRMNVSAGSHKVRINVLANDRGNGLRVRAVNPRSARGGQGVSEKQPGGLSSTIPLCREG